MKSVCAISPIHRTPMRITTHSGAVYEIGARGSDGLREVEKRGANTMTGQLGIAVSVDCVSERIPSMSKKGWISTSRLPDGRVIIPVDEIRIGDCLGILFFTDGKLAGAGSSAITKIEV